MKGGGPSLHFGDFEIVADSDSTPSKTSRKVISDHKFFSSFHFIRVLSNFLRSKTKIFIIEDRVLIFGILVGKIRL